jgi:hypothetical protein
MAGTTHASPTLPRTVVVNALVASRYHSGFRPESWDARVHGIDIVRSTEGEEIRLFSDGQQSPPQSGWTIMLTGGDATAGFKWTLYGLPLSRGQSQPA